MLKTTDERQQEPVAELEGGYCHKHEVAASSQLAFLGERKRCVVRYLCQNRSENFCFNIFKVLTSFTRNASVRHLYSFDSPKLEPKPLKKKQIMEKANLQYIIKFKYIKKYCICHRLIPVNIPNTCSSVSRAGSKYSFMLRAPFHLVHLIPV